MNRRNFLKKGSLTGATLSLSGLALAIPSPASARATAGDNDPHRNGALVPQAGESASAYADFPLLEATIDELQQKMKSGQYTSRSITEAYLQRISAMDKKGPALNAVIELNPDALAIADKMDAERKAGKLRGPLHGIPILVKDNIDSGDKMMTTAGSLALLGHHAAKDAFILDRLRSGGAVLLGKTNLSEWANFRSSRSTSGWSSRGGQTKMPYLLARNPSGSSAGTGSAVSANFCVVGIGTETNGSVVSPSSVNGLVGVKPTVGLLSRAGIIPISKTQDTAGPMTRTVRDAAILLGAMTGVDESDPATVDSRGKSLSGYTSFLDPAGLKGKRIGVEKNSLRGHEGVLGLLQSAIDLMKAQGATIVEVELDKLLNDAYQVEFIVLQYEFKDGLNKYLASANANVKSLADVIAFNKANAAKAMPYFKQETLERSEGRGGLDSPEYTDALKKIIGVRKIIDDLMQQNQLDALTASTNGLACCIDLVDGDYRTGFSFSGPAAMAGYPHITVPMGIAFGLPVGVSFVGRAWSEPELLKIAYAFEQASKKRTAPSFIDAPNPLY